MGQELIIIDSCVFIKAFRKDQPTIRKLEKLSGSIAYSVITYLELSVGANTFEKKMTIRQIFESYFGIPLNPDISNVAMDIMHTYISGSRKISVPDCLIAASSLVTGFPLFTYNTRDFDFIKGIRLFK